MAVMKLKPGSGLLFRAIPDDGIVRIRIGKTGRPEPLYPNRMILGDTIERELAPRTTTFWFPPEAATEYQGVGWILNYCADDDDYGNALQALLSGFGDRVPIFNHPLAVADSRRDRVARLMDGIPGLIAPRCIRVVPESADAFQKAFAASGMRYPVLVRPAASQSAEGLFRIDHPFGWEALFSTPWLRRPHYMTEFIETRRASGDYLKLRLCFIGDDISLRSYRATPDWLNKGMIEANPADFDTMFAARERFAGWTSLQRVAREIQARLRLDFFGADLGVMDDGRFVLFEANAAMTIAEPVVLRADLVRRMRPLIQEVEAGLRRHLANPSGWRMAHRQS